MALSPRSPLSLKLTCEACLGPMDEQANGADVPPHDAAEAAFVQTYGGGYTWEQVGRLTLCAVTGLPCAKLIRWHSPWHAKSADVLMELWPHACSSKCAMAFTGAACPLWTPAVPILLTCARHARLAICTVMPSLWGMWLH